MRAKQKDFYNHSPQTKLDVYIFLIMTIVYAICVRSAAIVI